MAAQQVRVLSLNFVIERDKLSAFERFCDLSDRGIGWNDLDRATYLVRESLAVGLMELNCTWSFSGELITFTEKIKGLMQVWRESLMVQVATEHVSDIRPWRVLHSYFAGSRQDSRSPLMDEVVAKAFVVEPESFAKIRDTNTERGLPPIALSPQDGHMLMNLLMTAGAKRGIEVGTLGGYSAAWICQAIGSDGMLVSIEKDAKRSRVAAENLSRLGFADRVECRAGDASMVLKNLSGSGPWDFVFIDADKGGYANYVAWAMDNVKPGGLILADNAYLWGGMLTFPNTYRESRVDESEATGANSRLHGYDEDEYEGMRGAWQRLSKSQNFDTWMLPSPEGLLVARKRTDV